MHVRLISAVIVSAALSAAPVLAGSMGAAPKPPGAAARPAPTTQGRSAAQTVKPPRTQTSVPKAHGPKTTPPAGAPKAHGKPAKPTAGTTSGTTTPSLNPVARKIASNPNLSAKIATLLPQGVTLEQASLGFKNQGQFIAALHVSQNLGIPFADLKTAMTGIAPLATAPGGHTTTEPPTLLSLGQAIKKLRPLSDAEAARKQATSQANADLSGR